MVTQLDDENDLIKLPQNNDTSVYYEYVASRFINYLGFEAHHPEIVENKRGVRFRLSILSMKKERLSNFGRFWKRTTTPTKD